MTWFNDLNQLTSWPFNQIVSKSPHLQELKIRNLVTTQENIGIIIDFCSEICQASDSLRTLDFYRSSSSPEDGNRFLSTLADDDDCINGTLEELYIFNESWFYERMDNLMLLNKVLLRQGTTLKSISM